MTEPAGTTPPPPPPKWNRTEASTGRPLTTACCQLQLHHATCSTRVRCPVKSCRPIWLLLCTQLPLLHGPEALVTCCNHGCCADCAAIWKGCDYLLDISCSTALQNLCQGDASWQQGAALDDAVIHSPADRVPPVAEPPTQPTCPITMHRQCRTATCMQP